MSQLADQIESIRAASGTTAFGVAIKHLESGEELYFDADRVFPLCSVFKTPVLCEAVRQIHEGRFRYEDRWTLTMGEKNLPSGILVYFQDGLQPTVRDLLTLMIIISDNTATDMIMHRIGVGETTRFMHDLGLTDIHVPMRVRDIFNDIMGEEGSDPRLLHKYIGKFYSEPEGNRQGKAYSLGVENDVGTPRALNALLEMIWQGKVVSRQASDDILYILLQQTLNQRLPRFLPEGTPFAHKTGTLSGIRNDSGILYCSETSHVAITTFTTWDGSSAAGDPVAVDQMIQTIDSAMGKIGLAVYEHFR
ncbi:MAG: serine hydrolase [Caldilineaceae bacterium]